MDSLTAAQMRVARFFFRYERKHMVPPSLREVGAALKVSAPVVSAHLQNLVRRGWAEAHAKRGYSRRYRLTVEAKRELLGGSGLGRLRQAWREATKAERAEFLEEVSRAGS